MAASQSSGAPPITPTTPRGGKTASQKQTVRERKPRNEQESQRRGNHRQLYERLRTTLKLPKAPDARVLVQAVRYLNASRGAGAGGS